MTIRAALIIAATLISVSTSLKAEATTVCPDGSYAKGTQCQIAPDGSYVSADGGPARIAPDGKYVGGEGAITVCPDGSYSAGQCKMMPDGTYR